MSLHTTQGSWFYGSSGPHHRTTDVTPCQTSIQILKEVVRVKTQKKAGRKKYTAEINKTCGRCKLEIPAGQPYWQDVSKTPMHPDCVRLKVVTHERPRFIQGNPVGRSCDGCGDTIRAGERVVHVMTIPWHHECKVRDVRLRT